MSWQAKPKGGYSVNSDEWKANLDEIYNQLGGTWTLQAICGMTGNFQTESGMNPWRWQSDTVSLTDQYKGYGLPQFTPAYGYIEDYGKTVYGYSPNLSTNTVTEGATPEDGRAQLSVIDGDLAGKFLNRANYCKFADISGCYPMSAYKQITDLWIATVGWLYNYEFPAAQYRTYQAAMLRYQDSISCYNYLSGEHPGPGPDPPIPPDPHPPSTERRNMKIYEYYNFKRRINQWL